MPFRFKKSQNIYVNSKYRTSPTDTTSNFSYDIKLNSPDYDHFCITSISIPKSFYQIDIPANYFYLIEEGIEYKIEIIRGNYSFNSLKVELQSLMNEITTSPYTYVLTIPNYTEPQTGVILFTVAGNSGVQPSFRFDDNGFASILGFVNNTTYTFVDDKLSSTNVVFLQKNESLLLVGDMISSEYTGTNNYQVLQHIFDTSVDFSFISWVCPDVLGFSKPLNHHSGVYHFQLCNTDGDNINLNGVNMAFSILFFKFDDTTEFQRLSLYVDNYEKLTKKI